jgi:hypothetical protein
MATPKGTRPQRFLLKFGDAVHVFSDFQAITLQLRHGVPTEVDIAATSFKASVGRTCHHVRVLYIGREQQPNLRYTH